MVWKVASLYIATVIGAGFASGQEIIQFFLSFGKAGIIGLVLATLALSLLGGAVIRKCYQIQTKNYKTLLFKIGGKEAPFLDLLYTTFLLAGLAIMLAGSQETFASVFGINGGQYLTAILVAYLLIRGPEQILNTSAFLVFFLIIYTGYIAIVTIVRGQFQLPQTGIGWGIPYSLLYPGYNLGFALAIFASISDLVPNEKVANYGGIVGGLVLAALIAIMMLAFWSGCLNVLHHPVPMLLLAERIGRIASLGYGLVLWLAMYTTAVANAYAVATRIRDSIKIPWAINCILVVSIACVISSLGFVTLIGLAYPLFGLVGIYLIYRLLHYHGKT